MPEMETFPRIQHRTVLLDRGKLGVQRRDGLVPLADVGERDAPGFVPNDERAGPEWFQIG
jgi:hypothetical protein